MTSKRFAAFPIFPGATLAVAGFAASSIILASILASASTPASAAGGAQYCLSRGSVNGDASYVGNCVYSDYQQCLQAAADSRGNCVQNIDYHGAPATAPAVRRTRRAR
jgi:hypothetical protein